MREPASSYPNQWQVLLLLFACALLYMAQSLQVWAWPALDGYPAIERWLDAGFLPNDFYTNTTVKFGVDTPQALVIGTLSRWTGVHYTVLLAGLTALRHLLWPFVLCGFFRAWSGDRLVALLGVMLGTLGAFALPKMLGWSWLWGDASTAMFAVLAATYAWTCFLERRAAATLWLMTLACLLQPLVSVHAGLMLAAIFVFDYTAAERRAVFRQPATLLAGLVFAVAFGAQYLMLTPHGLRLPTPEYVNILVQERHPGDFLVGRFGRSGVLGVGVGTLAVLVMAARIRSQLPRPALLLAVLAVYAAICVAGFVFVELWPVRLVVDLIPFRTVIIVAPLLLLVIAVNAADHWRHGHWLALALLALAFVAAGPLAAHAGAGSIKPALLLLLAGVAGWLPLHGRPLPGWLWPVLAVVLVALALPNARVRRDELVLPTAANGHQVYQWARDNTAPDARFLVEQFPTGIAYGRVLTPQRMRLIGRRSVVASLDYPFAETDLRPWYRTWVIGLGHGERGFVEKADLAKLQRICAQLPFDYVVRAKPLAGATPVAQFAPQQGVGSIFVYRPCAAPR